MINRKLVIIGGGPAGLAAAVAAYDKGERDILILERESVLGGILNQCIHNGFGLHTFKEELTGPEYAGRFIQQVLERNIEYKLDTTVIGVKDDKTITAVNETDGLLKIKADAIILACGCRERPRGAINIAGCRAAGIFSAGTAQKLVNIDGYLPGKECVILGSGDIGLIMARRMTLEGAKVLAVAELMPYTNGLARNVAQCLEDYDIPLYLSHTVTNVIGNGRVEAVVISQVDENGKTTGSRKEETLTAMSAAKIRKEALETFGKLQNGELTEYPKTSEEVKYYVSMGNKFIDKNESTNKTLVELLTPVKAGEFIEKEYPADATYILRNLSFEAKDITSDIYSKIESKLAVEAYSEYVQSFYDNIEMNKEYIDNELIINQEYFDSIFKYKLDIENYFNKYSKIKEFMENFT